MVANANAALGRRKTKRRAYRLSETNFCRDGMFALLARTKQEVQSVWERVTAGRVPVIHEVVLTAVTMWELRKKGPPRDWRHIVDNFREGDRLWLATSAGSGTAHLAFLLMRRGWVVDWELYEPTPQ